MPSLHPAIDLAVIPELQLWVDEMERDGCENMAVDEWLLGQSEQPILRVYKWQPHWGSFGYFVTDVDAAAALGDLQRVRRWTGGGIVNHTADWTYTLVFPGRDGLAGLKGPGCYCVIHRALAGALQELGHGVHMAGSGEPARGGECFIHPVEHDILDAAGKKMAGAGQRRTTSGLLHQGSLALRPQPELACLFAAKLGEKVRQVSPAPPTNKIQAIADARYRSSAWALRR